MGVEIVPLTVALLDEAATLDYRIAPRPWTRESFADELAQGSLCLAALAEGALVGFVLFRPQAEEWSLMNLGVAPTHRRQGLARRLTAAGLERIGNRRIILEVRSGNKPAIGLYRELGFRKIGLRQDYYPGPPKAEDALVMAREVESS